MITNIKIKKGLNILSFTGRSLQLHLFLFIIIGTVQLKAQPLSNHLIFDGVDDYISLNNIDVSGSQITLEALINSANLSNCTNDQCRIISKATSPSPADHYWMLSTTTSGGNTVLRFRLKTNGTTTSQVATVGALSENTWYHVAATYDGIAMKIFLNGNEVGRTPKTGNLTTDTAVDAWIGGNPPTATGHPWEGGIDEVRIWNTARTQAEIQANRNKTLTGNEAGLQAYYKFNEGTGQSINDSAGNNNIFLGSTNATDSNDPSFAINNPGPRIIDGSIVISDSESANPLAGTIRWTGQDLEGFDGTRWLSLTKGCDDESIDNPNKEEQNNDLDIQLVGSLKHTPQLLCQLTKPGTLQVNLYNMQGQQVSTIYKAQTAIGLQQINIDKTNLPRGIYFIHVRFVSTDSTIVNKTFKLLI